MLSLDQPCPADRGKEHCNKEVYTKVLTIIK